jgi:WhiB family redox-sensing transcriptional regulator
VPSNEGLPLLEGPGLPRELQSASDLDSSRGPSSPIDYDWHDHAACKEISTDKFYVGRGQKVCQEVVNACSACPVKPDCLQHALEHEEYGYWAGTNPVQREKIRKDIGVRLQPINFDFIDRQGMIEKVMLQQSLTCSPLPVILNTSELASNYYYPDEISFEELFYYE